MEEVAGAPLGRPSCHDSGAVEVGGMTGSRRKAAEKGAFGAGAGAGVGEGVRAGARLRQEQKHQFGTRA